MLNTTLLRSVAKELQIRIKTGSSHLDIVQLLVAECVHDESVRQRTSDAVREMLMKRSRKSESTKDDDEPPDEAEEGDAKEWGEEDAQEELDAIVPDILRDLAAKEV
eukprot:453315-Pyramimonas_sp.AAC.1